MNALKEDARRRALLETGAEKYVEAFADPPPKTRETLEAQIQDLPPEQQNPIAEALYWHPYARFVEKVAALMGQPPPRNR